MAAVCRPSGDHAPVTVQSCALGSCTAVAMLRAANVLTYYFQDRARHTLGNGNIVCLARLDRQCWLWSCSTIR